MKTQFYLRLRNLVKKIALILVYGPICFKYGSPLREAKREFAVPSENVTV